MNPICLTQNMVVKWEGRDRDGSRRRFRGVVRGKGRHDDPMKILVFSSDEALIEGAANTQSVRCRGRTVWIDAAILSEASTDRTIRR